MQVVKWGVYTTHYQDHHTKMQPTTYDMTH